MSGNPKKGDLEDDTVVGKDDPDPKGALQLVVVAETEVRLHPLPALGDLRIGRHSACEIRVDDASISRFHAVLHLKGTSATIEDLGSANGTRIAGQRIKAGKEFAVPIGETVRLGTVTLLIQPGGAKVSK